MNKLFKMLFISIKIDLKNNYKNMKIIIMGEIMEGPIMVMIMEIIILIQEILIIVMEIILREEADKIYKIMKI